MSCPRAENGRAVDGPCPAGTRCVNTGTAGVACLLSCAVDDDCPTPGCCQALQTPAGHLAGGGACAAPVGGDRSACRGPSAAARDAFVGLYQGPSTVTLRPDTAPAAPPRTLPGHRIELARAGEVGLWLTFDGACGAEVQVQGGVLRFVPGDRCTSVTLRPGAALTLAAGEGARAGGVLTLRVAFRYVDPAGGTGALLWDYRGTP